LHFLLKVSTVVCDFAKFFHPGHKNGHFIIFFLHFPCRKVNFGASQCLFKSGSLKFTGIIDKSIEIIYFQVIKSDIRHVFKIKFEPEFVDSRLKIINQVHISYIGLNLLLYSVFLDH
jgi:hypothetical protein